MYPIMRDTYVPVAVVGVQYSQDCDTLWYKHPRAALIFGRKTFELYFPTDRSSHSLCILQKG